MNDNIAEIKSRVTMQDICRRYGIDVNGKGFAKCVFHSDKTPSMKVYNNGTFHCFGCGANGDVIDFVKRYDGINTQQAIEKINREFALGLPVGRKPTSQEMRRIEQERKDIKNDKIEKRAIYRAYAKKYDDAGKKLCELVDRIKAIMVCDGDFEKAFERAKLIREKEYMQYVKDCAEEKMNEYRNYSA